MTTTYATLAVIGVGMLLLALLLSDLRKPYGGYMRILAALGVLVILVGVGPIWIDILTRVGVCK